MTPAEVRISLLERKRYLDGHSWIDMELIGGTRKSRERYEQKNLEDKLARQEEARQLQEIIDLPDHDIEWLLENGWSPV